MKMRDGEAMTRALLQTTEDAHAGGHTDQTAPLWFIFISLALGSFARTALHGSSVPYTVVLFVIGMLVALVYYYADLGMLEASLDAWSGINPHLLLAVFLPALIFESSFSMEWHTLRKVLPKVLILAGPGVLISMGLTGCVLRVFPLNWSWGFCMMVGSILAATDPVAVVAILKEVGASKILGHLIEGESLVNDGTAIVVFNVFLAIAKGEEKTFGSVIADLILQPLESVLIGVVVGQVCLIWLTHSHNDHLVDITITLFAGYISFMLAENVVHCSGVLAVVVLGCYMSANGRTFFKGHIQHSMHHFWEVLTYAANTIIFVLAGFLIVADILLGELDIKPEDLGWGILLYVLLNLIRLVVVTILYPWMNVYKGHELTLRESFICVWSGLRGAVGLALVLVVLEEESFTSRERGATLAMVSSAVIGTLLINASTAAAMLRIVGLLTPGLSHERTIMAARKAIHERALSHYEERLEETGAQYLGAPDFTAIKQLVPFLRTQQETEVEFTMEIAKMDAQLKGEMRTRFLAGLCKEVWSMLEDDLIDAKVAHGLLLACERATDKAHQELCDFEEFNRFMRQSRVKSRVLAWLQKRKLGQRLLHVMRYIRLAEEPWMPTRRQMQGLQALISVHRITSNQFKTLLGKDDEEAPAEASEIDEFAKSFTIKKVGGIGENLANETSMKTNHVRDVIWESEQEVERAVEQLKEMQQAHNAISRSLRSEALAREILEVTMAETKLLTHTGLLDESEGSMLAAEHDMYLQRLIARPLPPSRTSPGRILAAIPLFDPTRNCGIKNRDIRKQFLREAEVVEYKTGDIIVDPDTKPSTGLLLVGNGVVQIEDANDTEKCITAGCKSHPHAWALAVYEALANSDEQAEDELLRSGVRAIAQTAMFGFVIPYSLLNEIKNDEREHSTIEHLWRNIFAVLAETVLQPAISVAFPQAPVGKLSLAGKLVKLSKGFKLEYDERDVVVVLTGSLYNETCGTLSGPRVVDFKRTSMASVSSSTPERQLERKLESKLASIKFGKNGLVRGSSQNLVALAAAEESDKTPVKKAHFEEDNTTCSYECATDMLLYVIPTKVEKLMTTTLHSSTRRRSAKSERKKEFLQSLSRRAQLSSKTLRPEPSGTLEGVAIDAGDIEIGSASIGSAPRSPQRRLSLQLERPRPLFENEEVIDDPRTQLTSDSLPDSILSDENVQETHRSDGMLHESNRSSIWDDQPALPSQRREHPSTQNTIS